MTPAVAPLSEPGSSLPPSRFWERYTRLRVLGLAYPVRGDELVEGRVAKALNTWLGVDSATATSLAGRWALMRRDAALHEALLRRMPPGDLDALLDTLSVRGLERVDAADRLRGALLLSMHYSLYASMEVLWLARQAARGAIDHLAVLYVARPDAEPASFTDALLRSEGAGFIPRSKLRLIDLGGGSIAATRAIVDSLQAGGAALIFSDRLSMPGEERRAVTVRIGRGRIGMAFGLPWLAAMARAPVIPVHIEPDLDDHHAIVFGPSAGPTSDGCHSLIAIAMQYLVDQTAIVKPELWDGWPSLDQFDVEWVPSSPAGFDVRRRSN